MPDVSSTPVIASERLGLAVSRRGQPLALSETQMEHIRSGLEMLVGEGMEDDGFDVRRANPVRVRLTSTGPGRCDLLTQMHDARPLHRRLLSPLSAAAVKEARRLLSHAVETVMTGMEMLMIVVSSRSVVLGALEDEAGVVPMVTDGRFVMRVPWSIFRVLEASARAQEGADALKHLFEQDGSTITLRRGEGGSAEPVESRLQVPDGLWARIGEVRVVSFFDSVQLTEDPLQDLVTRSQRDDLPRVTRRDVGPDAPGRRGDQRMPPPGPRI